MKKLVLSFAILGSILVGTTACSETTREKTEDAAKSAGRDIDNAAQNVDDASEGAMEKLGKAYDDAKESVKDAGKDVKDAADKTEKTLDPDN